ncbi:MAG: hypothetical protein WAX12_02885 [Candidatus Microthrix subdominans]
MTTNPTTIDAAGWLRNHLESDDAGGDLLAALVKDFAEALMSAEASASKEVLCVVWRINAEGRAVNFQCFSVNEDHILDSAAQ